MTVTYDPVLSRVRIDADNLGSAATAVVERSPDQINWTTVRGGAEAQVNSGVLQTLDDYEFLADVPNYYRAVVAEPPEFSVGVGAGVSGTMDVPFTIPLPAGVTEGDLLVVYVASGWVTGFSATIPGYTRLPGGQLDDMFVKVASASEEDPQVSTAAEDDWPVVAQMVYLRGASLPYSSADHDNTVGITGANISYGPLTITENNQAIIYAGFKHDNVSTPVWTSVDTIPGATEIGEVKVAGTSSNVGIVWDYEFRAVAADVTEGQFVVNGATATNESGNGRVVAFPTGWDAVQVASLTPSLDGKLWLKVVARPYLNRQVTVAAVGDVQRKARTGVHQVVGRTMPIAISDVRGSREYELQLLTETPQESEDLDYLFASGEPVYLHVPADESKVLGGYFTVGDVSDAPVGRLSDKRIFTLPMVEVAPPGADVVGTTVTWQTVLDTYATWADLMAAHATWGSLLEMVAEPSEVIVQ
ncbi:hypothetical protein [Kribbella italica]|uniref:Uncharacterized protein n=1 Tax=Kribbella italica TaxID=1540520 RepID=A0A7W9J8V5_9ACTN|nr:hypothetical protein [Kribbella italica]MBB5837746.1 hypothetical protein [Kribbella italica]